MTPSLLIHAENCAYWQGPDGSDDPNAPKWVPPPCTCGLDAIYEAGVRDGRKQLQAELRELLNVQVHDETD